MRSETPGEDQVLPRLTGQEEMDRHSIMNMLSLTGLGHVNLGDSLTASLLFSVFNNYCVVLTLLCLRIDSAQTPVIIPCVVKAISWLFPL